MTKILAMCAINPRPPEQLTPITLEEIHSVTQQYLDGKLEQVWRREDGKGGMLVFGTSSLAEAESWVRELPLVREGFLTFELIPIGPLTS